MTPVDRSIPDFRIAGINYKKTDASVRGQYAINNEQYSLILTQAAQYGITELFILSTCNRTEIYGLTQDIDTLIDLLCTQTVGDKETFKKLAYAKSGTAAVEHLFRVSAGLDSQVLGDYEILGQVKQAAKFSKSAGFIGAFTERLINCAIQASKAIKSNTELSGGTVSVSFAAIQYIRDNVPDYKHKNILLIGTGKIGRNTCKNLLDYLHNENITLINRTTEKARLLAEDLGLNYAESGQTAHYIKQADIIITATNAQAPIITKADVMNGKPQLIIDLSVPYNADRAIGELEGVTLLNVDELSKMKDDTLQKREAEVPKANAIIAEHINEFTGWLEKRKHAPVLKSLKKKLQQLDIETADETRIQKVINTTALKLQTHNTKGCHYIQAINEFIAGVA